MIRELYENSEFKNIIHDVDNVYIPLDFNWKNIAVSLSGGADSAMLAYILCDLVKDKNIMIHCISHIRCWKEKPWQEYDSLNVYNWLVDRFPSIKFKRHTNFIPPDIEWGSKGPNIIDEYGQLNSGDIIEIRAFAEYIGIKENLDAYYNAVTRNPPIELNNKMSRRDVEPSEENFKMAITKHMGGLSCHPFRFIDKSWIYKQYKNKNLSELFNLTRSCEGTFENITYKNYKKGQYVPLCNQCFWCLEREWAIKS